MNYNPTNWQNGDIITAERLNKLENGVAESSIDSGSFNVGFELGDLEQLVATKTATELIEAFEAGNTFYYEGAPGYKEGLNVGSVSVEEKIITFYQVVASEAEQDNIPTIYIYKYTVADSGGTTSLTTEYMEITSSEDGGSSDSNIEIVDIDVAYPSMVATSSHTFIQILSAYQSGKLIIGRLNSPILANVEITYRVELTTNQDFFTFIFQNFAPILNQTSGTYTTNYGGYSFIIEISADGASVYDVSSVQIDAEATVVYHTDRE